MGTFLRAAAAVAALGIGLSGAAGATEIDIRDCPLDTVTFVDHFSGFTFAVKRVGTAYFHICAEGKEPPDESCSEPYGDLVLEGDYRTSPHTAAETLTAIWTVIKAAPCCGWTFEKGETTLTGRPDFRWVPEAEMPRLRDLSFLHIDATRHGPFPNPMIAATCTLR